MGIEFETDSWSWAYDAETTYGVKPAAPSWTAMQATLPTFTKGRDLQELNLATSSAWTMAPRQAGSRHGGTFTFTVPLRSQLSSYTAASANPAPNPEISLLAEYIGSAHIGDNEVADIAAASTAILWNLTAGTPDEGAGYYVGANGGTAVETIGFGEDLSGTAFTIEQDGIAAPSTGNDLLGMITLYPSNSQPDPRSFYLKGEDTTHALFLLGCIQTGATLRFINGKIDEMDMTFTFNGWEYDTAAGAGVLTATDYRQLPPAMKSKGGRLTIDGGASGTPDDTGRCGIGDVTIELNSDVYNRPCHGGSQGFSGIRIKRNPARVSFQVPWTDDDITSDQSDWDTSLEDQVPFSLMIQRGSIVGAVSALFMPQAVIVEQPQLAEVDNIMQWSLVASPKAGYTGDTGSTEPANSAMRLAFG